MPIEDVFQLQDVEQLPLVVSKRGVVNTGDAVDIIGMGAEKLDLL